MAAVAPVVPVVLSLADVEPEQVSWLWPGRLAKGKLNLLVGDPGDGKTFLSLDVAARLSKAAEWPDGGNAPKTSSLILTAEDGLSDTIRPRLDAQGADVTAISALEAVCAAGGEERAFSFDTDLVALKQAIEDTGAGLVIVDPLSAYLGKVDSFKDADVRRVLSPLARLAEVAKVAVLGIVHLTKDAQRRAVARVQGSVGFVGAARVVIAVAKDRGDERRRLVMPIKNNLTARAPVLAFRLDDGGRLVWEPGTISGVDVEAVLAGSARNSLVEGSDEPSKVDAAVAFLEEVLGPGPMHQEEVKRLAAERGIAERTLCRAKKKSLVSSERVGEFDDRDEWQWCLPAGKRVARVADVSPSEPLDVNVGVPGLGASGRTDKPGAGQFSQTDQSCQPSSDPGGASPTDYEVIPVRPLESVTRALDEVDRGR
jgi:putative DNA primase/helicase